MAASSSTTSLSSSTSSSSSSFDLTRLPKLIEQNLDLEVQLSQAEYEYRANTIKEILILLKGTLVCSEEIFNLLINNADLYQNVETIHALYTALKAIKPLLLQMTNIKDAHELAHLIISSAPDYTRVPLFDKIIFGCISHSALKINQVPEDRIPKSEITIEEARQNILTIFQFSTPESEWCIRLILEILVINYISAENKQTYAIKTDRLKELVALAKTIKPLIIELQSRINTLTSTTPLFKKHSEYNQIVAHRILLRNCVGPEGREIIMKRVRENHVEFYMLVTKEMAATIDLFNLEKLTLQKEEQLRRMQGHPRTPAGAAGAKERKIEGSTRLVFSPISDNHIFAPPHITPSTQWWDDRLADAKEIKDIHRATLPELETEAPPPPPQPLTDSMGVRYEPDVADHIIETPATAEPLTNPFDGAGFGEIIRAVGPSLQWWDNLEQYPMPASSTQLMLNTLGISVKESPKAEKKETVKPTSDISPMPAGSGEERKEEAATLAVGSEAPLSFRDKLYAPGLPF